MSTSTPNPSLPKNFFLITALLSTWGGGLVKAQERVLEHSVSSLSDEVETTEAPLEGEEDTRKTLIASDKDGRVYFFDGENMIGAHIDSASSPALYTRMFLPMTALVGYGTYMAFRTKGVPAKLLGVLGAYMTFSLGIMGVSGEITNQTWDPIVEFKQTKAYKQLVVELGEEDANELILDIHSGLDMATVIGKHYQDSEKQEMLKKVLASPEEALKALTVAKLIGDPGTRVSLSQGPLEFGPTKNTFLWLQHRPLTDQLSDEEEAVVEYAIKQLHRFKDQNPEIIKYWQELEAKKGK